MPTPRKFQPRHTEEIRNRIKVSQLINFLQDHVLENKHSENASTRVRAAIALINKFLPDVSEHKMEHFGAGGGPIEIKHIW